jgi:hypothetical protein
VNLAAVPFLTVKPQSGIWHRAVDAYYLPSAISTAHTPVIPTRFYDPGSALAPFASLYLSDDRMVSLFEAQALFGSPMTPGGTVSAPKGNWVSLSVTVSLAKVVDLSDVVAQTLLGTSVQELTGDWQGYRQRAPTTPVSAPVGAAPTQLLGEAIQRDARALEGLLTVSARISHHRNLVIFPGNMDAASSVAYDWRDVTGAHRFEITRANPSGIQLF